MESSILKLLLFLLFSLLSSSTALVAVNEAAALLAFKQSSIESDTRDSLRNWISTTSSSAPCSWAGVNCSSDGRVIGLKLRNLGIVGHLRIDNLLALTSLTSIDLRGNSFYGNLSHSRSSSSNCSFEVVDLSQNNFTEIISGGFLAACDRLISLNLSHNSIPGGIYPIGLSLQRLDLSHNRISDVGLLNHSLSNCRNLLYLNFSGNHLTGEITSPSACANLAVLDLSSNPFSSPVSAGFMSGMPASLKELVVANTNFSGDLSNINLGPCGNLTSLDLSANAFSGLPPSLANCQALERLDLSSNQFTGVIPAFLANLLNLRRLSLAGNRFSGQIPPELAGICPTLRHLDLSMNLLTGELPSEFVSCTALQSLNLGSNEMTGFFVTTVVGALTSLQQLRLPFNNLTGIIPLLALRKCLLLEVIDLGSNQFSGEIPVGFCSALPQLQKLLLPNNYLTGPLPPELAECNNLQSLDLSFNLLHGAIPPEIFTLPRLVDLVMWANNFSGEIPDNLCSNGSSLETLILNHNAITGGIPASLTRCRSLIWVSLSGNQLTGPIPADTGDLPRLAILQLGNNSLTGGIPVSLGNCPNLIWVDLNLNNLSGPIPASLAAQAGLVVPGMVSGKQFAFLRNEGGTSCPGAGVMFEFAGIRPERLAAFPPVHACPTTRIYAGMMVYTFPSNGSMIYLDLSYNSLSGSIPESIGNMSFLQVLNLGHNRLTGSIPRALGGLRIVGVLDVSHNSLTGSIPGELGSLSFLNDLDVSNNNLSGPIPTSGQLMTFPASKYENNSALCGSPLPPCGLPQTSHTSSPDSGGKRRLLTASVLTGIAISALVIVALVLILFKVKSNQKTEELRVGYVESLPTSGTTSWKLSGVLEPLSINVATFEKPLRKLTFAHLLEATNGFSAGSLIGSGGFGEVYKARLKDGSVVAIKKLIHVTNQGDREFVAEMETIGKIKHRNLVPLLGYCKVGDERLLVYEHMKHGSLDMALHDRAAEVQLDWAARKKIAVGAARGLAFLHHSCIPHIIHRDMKSSNVLLDANLEARVSDFGMARLVNALDTHLSVSTLAGTPGYVPPEYYQSFRCTTKGDVYSYGVVLLELLSGKRPIDAADFGDNNLVGWAKQLVKEDKSHQVFDPDLLEDMSAPSELYRYLRIACQCLEERPTRRPTMVQVMAMFKEFQTDTDSDVLDELSTDGMSVDESKEKV